MPHVFTLGVMQTIGACVLGQAAVRALRSCRKTLQRGFLAQSKHGVSQL
jgi:hypothetical protein